MRDKERIKRIIGIIEATWERHQDMRFYQLLINMGLIEDNTKLWLLEDDELEEFLEKHKL